MSRERELLNKALAVLLELKDCSDSWCEYYVPIGIHYRIDEAIQELLAQPEQTEKEPVAWMQDSIELYVLEEKSAIRGYVIPLYTAPPKREPLSDEEIHKLSLENFKGLLSDRINFVRAIEKEHGIGGGE